MPNGPSRVTIHMASSLDGFIAGRDGRIDWMEVADTFERGESMTAASVDSFLETIDCYVMGARTYETALDLEAKGFGWSYGENPVFVLTHRVLRKAREGVEFCSGDLRDLFEGRLRPRFRNIWVVGGGEVSAACLRLELADEVRYSFLPVAIGDGLSFFRGLDRDIAFHLLEVTAYTNGVVALRYEVRKSAPVESAKIRDPPA